MANRGGIGLVIVGTPELAATVRRLKEAGDKGMMRELRKEMRKAGAPLLKEARRNVGGISSAAKGSGSGRIDRYEHTLSRSRKVTDTVRNRAARQRGLRAAVAGATRLEVKTGGKDVSVRLKVNSRMLPADQRKLPVHLNTGRWRHPVFGNRHAWVTQTAAARGWFTRATVTHGPGVRNGARIALDTVIGRIA